MMVEHKSSSGKQVPLWASCRLHLACAVAMGYLVQNLLRYNLSVAIICIVDDLDAQRASVNNYTKDDNRSKTPPSIAFYDNFGSNPGEVDPCGETWAGNNTDGDVDLAWSKTMQGAVLSSFYYGYIVTQIPGGWLADRFGGKHVFGTSILLSAICTMLTPVAARANPYIVVALRVVTGLAMGVSYPATHAMWGRWAPPLERARLVSFSYAGGLFGIFLAMSSSGLLCSVGANSGWPLIFYIHGAVALVWLVWWYLAIHSFPDIHPRISAEEKEYLLKSIGKSVYMKKGSKPPWFDILTSKAVWAIVIVHTCDNWGVYTILTSVPTYMQEVLRFYITANGFLMASPYIIMYAVVVVTGQLADVVQRKGFLSTTAIRKWNTVIATVIPAMFIAMLGYMDCERRNLSVAMFVATVIFTAFGLSGYLVNHVDIAPKYAGVLFGWTNAVATIPGMVSPLLVGVLTPNGTQQEWQTVFFICSAFYIAGAFSYVILGSGELQSWAKGNTYTIEEIEIEASPKEQRKGLL